MIRTTICTALMLMPGLAFAESENLRINNITLFEAGLAEINLDAADREEVELTIPLKDIDDVLKSLIVTGDFSARPLIRLSGENPVEDAFMASPIGSGQISDVADILSAIRGTQVELTGLDRSAEGVVMGVSQSGSCTAEGHCVREVTLLSADGTVLRFPLDHADGSDAGVKLKILDQAIVDAMATGLAALAEQSNGKIRTISIELGAGAADAGLSYVVQAPMWKTAYRTLLEDGEDVSLQAWAVIENATPSEWEDVSLTISSGSPVTLSARLHSRQWGARDIYQADNNAGAVRSQNRKALQALSSAGFASADAVESFAASPAPMAELEVATTAVETLTDSRFTFPDKISISSGEMISVPFLAEDLEAERLTVWNGGMGLRSGSPDMILQVDNDLPVRLPAGIMTIHSNESGYVGDASFPMLAPGDEAQVKFGTDTKVTISEKIASRRYERELKISRGVVTLIDEEVTETTYRISAPGVEGRTLMIDHPYRTNVTRKVTGAEGEELIAKPGRREVVRYTVESDPDEINTVIVEERRPVMSSTQIGNVNAETLLLWSNRATSSADKRFLERVAGLMRTRNDAQVTITNLNEERQELIAEQRRVADLIKTVPNLDDLRGRYLATLSETEDRLEEVSQEKQEAEASMAQTTKQINDMLE